MPQPVYLPNLIDETRFRPREEWPCDAIEEIRQRLNVSESQKICLIPARLEKVKGLVPFFGLLTPEMLAGWKILLMGQGSLREDVLGVIHSRGLTSFVELLDYVPYEEMPRYYAASDLFLLPSVYDPNPLSVIEALHSGLPVALSCMAGNVEEAVSDGENGWILHVMDSQLFSNELKKIFSVKMEELCAKGKVSKTVNSRFWNTKAAVARFIAEVTK